MDEFDLIDIRGPGPVTWMDVSDLINYAEAGYKSVTGIQRVVANLVLLDASHLTTVIPVSTNFRTLQIRAIRPSRIRDLAGELQRGARSERIMADLLEKVFEDTRDFTPVRGDTFLLAGAFWIRPQFDFMVGLRRSGVICTLYVYDLIQISNPEYLTGAANNAFRLRFIDLAVLINNILTISEFVRGEVEAYLASRLRLTLPVEAVTLATQLPANAAASGVVDDGVRRAASRPFVLCVGTLEVRKNHMYLVRVWQRLRREGRRDLPDLVFVGKWGWQISELKQFVESMDAGDTWIHVFNELSDSSLDFLYRNCIFTAFVSFVEGWGLPIGESLAHGKLCVASNATSMPEVGRDLAMYVDPFDDEDGLRVFRRLVDEPGLVAAREALIRETFVPKTWTEFAREFFTKIAEQSRASAAAGSEGALHVPSGKVYFFSDMAVERLDGERQCLLTLRMARIVGWRPVGKWSATISDRCPELAFRTDLAAGTPIRVYLCVGSSLGHPPQRLSLEIGRIVTRLGSIGRHPTVLTAEGDVGEGGEVRMRFELPDGPGLEAGQVVDGFELFFVGFAASADAASRAALAEDILLASSLPELRVPAERWEEQRRRAEVVLRQHLGLSLPGGGGIWAGVLGRRLFPAVLWLARFYARRRHWSSAGSWYRRALNVKPESAPLWVQFGHSLKEQGFQLAAAGAYTEALARQSGSPEVAAFLRDALDTSSGAAQAP